MYAKQMPRQGLMMQQITSIGWGELRHVSLKFMSTPSLAMPLCEHLQPCMQHASHHASFTASAITSDHLRANIQTRHLNDLFHCAAQALLLFDAMS
jgi:hypothetical protein